MGKFVSIIFSEEYKAIPDDLNWLRGEDERFHSYAFKQMLVPGERLILMSDYFGRINKFNVCIHKRICLSYNLIIKIIDYLCFCYPWLRTPSLCVVRVAEGKRYHMVKCNVNLSAGIEEGNPIFYPETSLEKDHTPPIACPKSGGVWWDADEQCYKM